MATKKEKTKEQRIKTEKTRLKGIFKDLDENKRKLVTPLIEKAAFMSIELDDLQAKLEKDGWTSEYQNGQNQWGTKKSPEAETYIALSKNYAAVINWLARIEHFLREELKLEFNPKTTILAAKNGIDFVGYKHRATHRKVRKDSIKHIKRTIKKCESGKITKEQLQKSIQSWTGHAGHADSYNLRKKIETLAEAAIEKAA